MFRIPNISRILEPFGNPEFYFDSTYSIFNMTVEEKLINLGSIAIRTVQMMGYFPVSIAQITTKMGENKKVLTFKFLSPIVVYSFLLLLSSASWEFVYLSNLRTFLRYIKLFGPTERYAHHSWVLVISSLGIFFRTAGFWDMKQTLAFWKQNCSTLEKLQVLLGHQKEDLIDQRDFQSIRGKLRWSTCFNLCIIVIHITIVYGRRFYYSFTDETKGWTEDVTFHMGSGYWFFLSLFHAMYSLWLCYFIHIYTAGFACLSQKIRCLRDSHHFPGVIYVSEIIGVNNGATFLNSGLAGPSKTQQFNGNLALAGTAAVLETQLNRFREAFSTLEKQVLCFNDFFGSKLIMEMILCITNLVVHSFFAVLWLGRGSLIQVAQLVIPITVFLYQLYNFGTVAGRMTLSAESVANSILESVPFGLLGSETKLRMQILTTKIWNDPPVISAKYFFVVNRHLVTSVLSAMTTFLVVLVQFKDADNAEMSTMISRMPRFNTNGTFPFPRPPLNLSDGLEIPYGSLLPF